jgi:hypothetical protein
VTTRLRNNDVFINCPFDPGYRPIFDAIVFSVLYLGFVPRCSLEDDDAGEFRLSKIQRIVEECRFGINDLSSVALDAATGLPRFNMPLELGLFLGCKRFGPVNQSKKRTLVLDTDQYRYRTFISDISGQDIRAHGGDPQRAIREVRDWLRLASKRTTLPGGTEIIRHHHTFKDDLPEICSVFGLEPDQLTFLDLSKIVADWLRRDR